MKVLKKIRVHVFKSPSSRFWKFSTERGDDASYSEVVVIFLGMYIRSTLPHPHMKSHSVQLQLAEKTLSVVGECERLWNNCTIRSEWACARGCQTKVKSNLKSSAKNSSIKPPRFKSCTNSCFSGEAWKLLMDRIELTTLTTMTMSQYATLVQHVPRSTNIAPVIPKHLQ